MKTSNLPVYALIASALFALNGCETTSALDPTTEKRIRVNSGEYKADNQAISGDIKSILLAGGLDVNDPSSAHAGVKTGKDAGKGENAAFDIAVASLKATGDAGEDMLTAEPEIPALAMVATPSSRPSVRALNAAPTPPVTRTVLETKIVIETPEVVDLGSINMSPEGSMDDYLAAHRVPPPAAIPTPRPSARPAARPAKQIASKPNVVVQSDRKLPEAPTPSVRRF